MTPFILDFPVSILEPVGHEPQHKARFQLQALETRMDYMGSSILMGRASGLAVVTKDEWKIRDAGQRRSGYGHREYDLIATRRLVGVVEWGTNVEKLKIRLATKTYQIQW